VHFDTVRSMQRLRTLSLRRWSSTTRTTAALPDSKRVKVELACADIGRERGGACECLVEYVELPRAPSASTLATLVLLHGSPGSIGDFRYLFSPGC